MYNKHTLFLCVCAYLCHIHKLCLMIATKPRQTNAAWTKVSMFMFPNFVQPPSHHFDVTILDHLEAAVTASKSIAPRETNGSNTNTEETKSSQHPYHWDAKWQGWCSEHLAPHVAKADKYAAIPIICTSLVMTMSQHILYPHLSLALSGSSWLGTSPSPVSPPHFQ